MGGIPTVVHRDDLEGPAPKRKAQGPLIRAVAGITLHTNLAHVFREIPAVSFSPISRLREPFDRGSNKVYHELYPGRPGPFPRNSSRKASKKRRTHRGEKRRGRQTKQRRVETVAILLGKQQRGRMSDRQLPDHARRKGENVPFALRPPSAALPSCCALDAAAGHLSSNGQRSCRSGSPSEQ